MQTRMHRRDFLAGVAALAGPAALAQAGDYPTRPVKVIVSFTAGGTTDILARMVCDKLAARLMQPFVVDNKPGAGGNIGSELAVRAAPDGHTLLVSSVGPIAVNPLTELVPVVQIADAANVLVVHPSVPAATFADLVAYGKANPDKVSYASTGVGTSSHLCGFMLARRTGMQAVHVPYKGSDALTDLLAGRVTFMFATVPSVIAQIRAGRLRGLAVSTARRSRALPEVPTVIERGFAEFEAGSWTGFFAPRGTPDAVVTALNGAVNAVLPSLEAQMVNEGADPVGGTPAQFRQFVAREFEKWRAVVRESGATAG